jgi:hypothetical protein
VANGFACAIREICSKGSVLASDGLAIADSLITQWRDVVAPQ